MALQQGSLESRTRESFGYQWTEFAELVEVHREHFLNYVSPIEPSFFTGKLGLDAGCGFGRHVYWANRFGARMVGIDFSDAIFSAKRMLAGQKGARCTAWLVKGSILHLPFKDGVFDFVYSLGVLHHLPQPLEGFLRLRRLVKKGGALFIWVYSKRRHLINAALECVRRWTTRLSFSWLKDLCFLCAALDWVLFIAPHRWAKQLFGKSLDALFFPRVRLYAKFPFRVCFADWFDRLSAPIRYYYDEADMTRWAEQAQLQRVGISPTGAYGWRLLGYKK